MLVGTREGEAPPVGQAGDDRRIFYVATVTGPAGTPASARVPRAFTATPSVALGPANWQAALRRVVR